MFFVKIIIEESNMSKIINIIAVTATIISANYSALANKGAENPINPTGDVERAANHIIRVHSNIKPYDRNYNYKAEAKNFATVMNECQKNPVKKKELEKLIAAKTAAAPDKIATQVNAKTNQQVVAQKVVAPSNVPAKSQGKLQNAANVKPTVTLNLETFRKLSTVQQVALQDVAMIHKDQIDVKFAGGTLSQEEKKQLQATRQSLRQALANNQAKTKKYQELLKKTEQDYVNELQKQKQKAGTISTNSKQQAPQKAVTPAAAQQVKKPASAPLKTVSPTQTTNGISRPASAPLKAAPNKPLAPAKVQQTVKPVVAPKSSPATKLQQPVSKTVTKPGLKRLPVAQTPAKKQLVTKPIKVTAVKTGPKTPPPEIQKIAASPSKAKNPVKPQVSAVLNKFKVQQKRLPIKNQ